MLLLVPVGLLFAQERTVKGHVVDKETKDVLIGLLRMRTVILN